MKCSCFFWGFFILLLTFFSQVFYLSITPAPVFLLLLLTCHQCLTGLPEPESTVPICLCVSTAVVCPGFFVFSCIFGLFIYLFIVVFFFFGLAHSEVNNLNSSLIRSDFWKILWVLINLKKTIGVLGSILKTFTNTSYTQMLNQLSLCSGFIGTETRQRQRLMAASLL